MMKSGISFFRPFFIPFKEFRKSSPTPTEKNEVIKNNFFLSFSKSSSPSLSPENDHSFNFHFISQKSFLE